MNCKYMIALYLIFVNTFNYPSQKRLNPETFLFNIYLIFIEKYAIFSELANQK